MSDPLDPRQGREPTSGEKSDLQDYTRKIGTDMVLKVFKVDLDLLHFNWQQALGRFSRYEAETAGVGSKGRPSTGLAGPARDALAYKVSLRIDQTDDIRRLESDPWDIPFAVKLKAESRLIRNLPEFRAEIYVPMSYKDELWIRTEAPIPGLSFSQDEREAWRAFSNYSTRQGVNTLETGLGRLWFGDWNFRYGYRVRFEDPGTTTENRHIWTLGRDF